MALSNASKVKRPFGTLDRFIKVESKGTTKAKCLGNIEIELKGVQETKENQQRISNELDEVLKNLSRRDTIGFSPMGSPFYYKKQVDFKGGLPIFKEGLPFKIIIKLKK